MSDSTLRIPPKRKELAEKMATVVYEKTGVALKFSEVLNYILDNNLTLFWQDRLIEHVQFQKKLKEEKIKINEKKRNKRKKDII
ncbi:hypothetical protein [Pasteurella multocida]|uniref:hypothetical protein n=1 Tax=Pasteurella multocida TaxID=747 RepID=UPI00147D97E9|nr:hypothetical protein [Pasteurella multocida]NNH97750.1 hypothetical protein [Pasteurella multocida]NNI42907.1 hypothetical protein [Pasteurella multocida]